jgi:cytochrome c nitrite reductase small subunit
VGAGALVARLANATSYLSDDPEACINCHVMANVFATWERGSHGHVAVCNDCHVPHTNPVATWAFKARDGTRHSYVFTRRLEPQVLRLADEAVHVVQGNCIRCHMDQVAMVRVAAAKERTCWECHTGTHGEVHSLSASPDARKPALPPTGLPIDLERKPTR